jgi:hypothetical protein
MATERKRNRSRRSASTARPRSYSELYKREQATPNVTPAPTETTVIAPRTAPTIDWQSEYAYVGQDLRKLLIVSTTLLALIVIAGFFV